jgi:hypothetical protein
MEQMHTTPISARQLSTEAAARLKRFKEYAISHPLLHQVDTQLTRAIDEPAGLSTPAHFWLILVFGEPLGKFLHLTFSCPPSPHC